MPRVYPARNVTRSAAERAAAVDDERFAGDPGRGVGEQEGPGLADVRWDAEAAQGIFGRHLLLPVLVQGTGEGRLDHGGCDRVDPHARPEFHPELAGEVDER